MLLKIIDPTGKVYFEGENYLPEKIINKNILTDKHKIIRKIISDEIINKERIVRVESDFLISQKP